MEPVTCIGSDLTMCRLASKLKTAKVSREQHLQKQEKSIITQATREYEDLFAEKLEQDRCAAVKAEETKQWERRQENFRAREKLEVCSFTAGHARNPVLVSQLCPQLHAALEAITASLDTVLCVTASWSSDVRNTQQNTSFCAAQLPSRISTCDQQT